MLLILSVCTPHRSGADFARLLPMMLALSTLALPTAILAQVSNRGPGFIDAPATTNRLAKDLGNNTLTVRVVDPLGLAGIGAIHIVLIPELQSRMDTLGDSHREGYCNSQGFYIFNGLPDGEYTVSVEPPGHSPQRRSISLHHTGQEQMTVQVTRTIEPQSDESGDTVSVKSLAIPEKARKEFAKAQQAFKRQDYEGTVRDLQAAVAIESSFAAAYNLMGLAYWRMDKPDLGKDAFENAMRVDPKFLPPYLNYGEMLIAQKDLEHAGHVLDEAARKWPARGEPLLAMAQMQYNAGNLNSAEQACRSALDRGPQAVPDAHLLLSNIYMRENRLDLVSTELEGYLNTAPFGAFAKAARQKLATIKRMLTPGSAAARQ